MKKVSGILSHPLTVEEPLVLTGTAQRGVIVCEGGSLDLRGAVTDRLTIEAGGYVLMSGTCDAAISVHEGGLLEIAGSLNGFVVKNEGEIWAMSGSIINSRTLSSGGFLRPIEAGDGDNVIESPRFRLTGVGEALDVAT